MSDIDQDISQIFQIKIKSMQTSQQMMISQMPDTNNNIYSEMAINHKIKQIESESSIRSSDTNNSKYKIPDVIHQEIKKLAQSNYRSPNIEPSNESMKATSKISQSKNLENRQNRADCEICELSVPAKSLISIGSCEHKYCNSCLHQYILYKINTFQAVECPNQHCNQRLLQTSTVYASLPLGIRKKFKKIQQYNQLLKNPNKRLCPNENCEGYLQVPPEGIIRTANPTCNQCHEKFCAKCSFREHSGECSDSQLQVFHDTLHYRQCSRCKKIIEKISGCNHITCPCGYQFCYICGRKWRNSHRCNNPYREPIANLVELDCGQACKQFLRITFGIFWVLLGLPYYVLFIIIQTILHFLFGIAIGLFAIPCYVCSGQSQLGQLKRWQILIMILLLPLAFLLFIGLGIKITLTDLFGKQETYWFCIILSCIWNNDCFH